MKEVNADIVNSIMEGARWDLAGVKIENPEVAPVDSKQPVKESKEGKVETHVCPLCESVLKAPLTDEQLLEHAASISEVFEEVEKALQDALNEEEDLDDGDDAEADEDDELEDEEVDSDEESDEDEE